MKMIWLVMIPGVLLMLLVSGCYTQFYKPGMEQGYAMRGDTALYNRYDSTAIDTSLTRPEENYNPGYGWQDWGRQYRPSWDWDFYGYTPDYYWGYYGYNNYYGTPWWYNYYNPWYPSYPPGSGQPAEPPSQRQGGRRQHSTSTGNVTPAPPPAAPTYTPPAQNQNPPPPSSGNDNNDNGRSGRRGR
jgi:hypothetical protein